MNAELATAESVIIPEGTLFYRAGRVFTGQPKYDKGKPYTIEFKNCGRCGGAGGSEKWKYTGWTCYQCGGSHGRNVSVKLYTAEKIAKMDAANEKRQAAKTAIRQEAARKHEEQRASRREQFAEDNKSYFESVLAICDTNSISSEIISTAKNLAELTTNQRETLDRMVAEIQRKEASQFIGEIGERREFTCNLIKFFDWSKPGNYGRTFYKYCHIMRDENGQTIKYIGSVILGGVKWQGEYSDRYPVVDESETLLFVATIEAHESYKNEKQTVVARPKVKQKVSL